MIVAGVAAVRYENSLLRRKEATLKTDLFIMRKAIQQYTRNRNAPPTSIDDLVQAKYLRSVPVDPITLNRDWHTDSKQILLDPQQTQPGITDVHSASDMVSPFEHTPYNAW